MERDRPQAVIHVDLDGATQIFQHHGWQYPYDDDPIFETGFRSLLAFLDRNRLCATLFVIASDIDVPRKLALLKKAVSAGHEIASHTLTHPELDSVSLEQKRAEIAESRENLERALQTAVLGFRAPSYQVDRDTLELLAQCGYSYDSSTFPSGNFARRLEVPTVLPFPHRPLLHRPLLELPLPAYLPAPFPFSPSYSLVLGQRYFEWGLRRFEGTGSPLVLLFHLTDFAEPLPEDRLVGIKSKIFTLSQRSAETKQAHCQHIINRVRQSFDITDTATLVDRQVAESGKRRLVLGISTTHETGATVFDGHKCLAAISEERLDRVKFSTKYPPERSIKAVIETAAIRPHDITDVVVAGLPPRRLFKRMLRGQLRDTLEFHGWNDYFPHFNKVLYRAFAFVRSLGYRGVLRFLESDYGIHPRIHFVSHHQCHAAAAYRTAPFDDALIVTADGVGDDTSLTISAGQGGRMRLLHLVSYPHSLGQFYTGCTQVLGFRANRHEGKITGLSAYGRLDPELYRKVKSTIRNSGPDFRLDKRYYSEGIIRGWSLKMMRNGVDLFEALQYRNYKTPLKKLVKGYPREDVAAVFQTLLEEELIAIIRPFAERTQLRNLCLAGGLFANVKANAALFRTLGFERVYIYPHMGDGGLGPGAALEFLQAAPTSFDSVYWGPSFTEEEMECALAGARDAGIRYRREQNVEQVVAALLADKKVVARFNGRMEFGPRALGNRSILYSASDPEANTWLNKQLGRTEFMPFAPVVMVERAPTLFKDIQGTEHACKFMTIILECTEWTKEKCPAVVHVDGTARPQFVSESINPSLYSILVYYEKLTGIPLLVNTSFNMHEEPIVCTPEDAVRAYLASHLDYLALGPFLAWIEKADDDVTCHGPINSSEHAHSA